MVVNIHELQGRSFLCAYVYDDNYLTAQVIAPIEEKPLTKQLRQIVWANCNDLPAFDVWTSTDSIYLACLAAPDMTGHFKTQAETSETLRGFEDEKMQTALIDIYKLEDPNETEKQIQAKQLPKWRTVLISCMYKLIERLEGETKDGMETIQGL